MTYDKHAILTLAQKLFVEAEWPYIKSCLETMSNEHSRALYVDGDLAAFIVVNKAESGNAFISYCGVDAKHQGKGYGSKLLKETLISIFQVDFPAVRLYVDDWNGGARRLYERLGFKNVGSAVVAGSACALMELPRADWHESIHT
jgi:ribosomal protein S18 acetylase RimI-like enzyme